MPLTEPKYYVQSSQVRDERRAYWIEERTREPYVRHGRCVADFGTNKRKAERECERMNREAKKPR